VDTSVFRPGPTRIRSQLGVDERARLIVNPRGIREYVRTDAFFAALPAVLEREPDVHVVCPSMAHSSRARQLRALVPQRERIHLLPSLHRPTMADLFRAARLSVSLSTHDGTPNTLLEAMACGALPLTGPVDSVLEWITHQSTG
jgi:glycosyltransferase involved in cell wall biosynthesis